MCLDQSPTDSELIAKSKCGNTVPSGHKSCLKAANFINSVKGGLFLGTEI
jgi:hypothetical protein